MGPPSQRKQRKVRLLYFTLGNVRLTKVALLVPSALCDVTKVAGISPTALTC